MTIEQVPDIPTFRQDTAAFIHDLPQGRGEIANHPIPDRVRRTRAA
jgi:hypothetical protein